MAKPNFELETNRYEKSSWYKILPAATLAADLRVYHEARAFTGLMIEVIVTGAAALSFTPKLETTDADGNVILLWTAAAAVIADGTVIYAFVEGGGAPNYGAAVTEKLDFPVPRNWNLFLDHTAGTGTVAVHICYL